AVFVEAGEMQLGGGEAEAGGLLQRLDAGRLSGVELFHRLAVELAAARAVLWRRRDRRGGEGGDRRGFGARAAEAGNVEAGAGELAEGRRAARRQQNRHGRGPERLAHRVAALGRLLVQPLLQLGLAAALEAEAGAGGRLFERGHGRAGGVDGLLRRGGDRKSTRLNSSHVK